MTDGFVGSIASFVIEGDTEVTYWIDRSFWGRGIASRALGLLLELNPVRPLFARVVSDNIGSLKVLQKGRIRHHRNGGFVRQRPERGDRGNDPPP
ncbi:GNAT family N-acetyltransferase [Catellatospora sichuanensis]|uniref:GNAT family N-acetyltransferase n=1 Tax=Catellatospora sichuanensis TaxID=1969805 RepID=UPI001FEA3E7E|nr:GNAT family N-acetyltransferase [Catellatospora sichuanensis]